MYLEREYFKTTPEEPFTAGKDSFLGLVFWFVGFLGFFVLFFNHNGISEACLGG